MPLNTGKGWHPAFEPDATGEVVALADEIRQKREALESISQAIKDFVDMAGGSSLQLLEDQHTAARRNLADHVIRAKNTTSLAKIQNRHMSSAEIQDLPEVVAANAALAEARPAIEAEINDLQDRLLKAKAILNRSVCPTAGGL